MNYKQQYQKQAPEKIYGWRDNQLSIARHYGGMKFRGASYLIDVKDPDQPLVRQDILQAEIKAKKQAAKAKKPKDTTENLFGHEP